MEQPQLVYITNLEGGLQKDITKLYEEEVPNNKKPTVKNTCFEEPALNKLNHIYELNKESGSDDKNIEEIAMGENKRTRKNQATLRWTKARKESKLTC